MCIQRSDDGCEVRGARAPGGNRGSPIVRRARGSAVRTPRSPSSARHDGAGAVAEKRRGTVVGGSTTVEAVGADDQHRPVVAGADSLIGDGERVQKPGTRRRRRRCGRDTSPRRACTRHASDGRYAPTWSPRSCARARARRAAASRAGAPRAPPDPASHRRHTQRSRMPVRSISRARDRGVLDLGVRNDTRRQRRAGPTKRSTHDFPIPPQRGTPRRSGPRTTAPERRRGRARHAGARSAPRRPRRGRSRSRCARRAARP